MSLGARVGRAILWGQAGRVAEASLFFVFSLVLARSLGPASYGLYALGMSLAGVCVFVTLLGLGPETLGRFLPEMVAKNGRGYAGRLLKKLLAVRVVAVLGVAGTVFLLREELARRFHFPLYSGFLALVLLVFAARSILDLLTYFSSGLLDLRRVAAAKLAASLVAPCVFLVLWLRHSATASTAWLATATGALAGILVLAIPFFAYPSASRGVTAISVRRILAFGMFAWASNFFIFILGDSTDVLLLGWLVRDPAAVGYYAVGAKIVFSLTGLLLGWASLVSVATFSEAFQQGGVERLASLVEAQWKIAVLCLLGPFLLLIRYGQEIIVIFYSPAYLPAVRVLEILSGLIAGAVVLGFSLGLSALYAMNHERLACGLVGAAAAFNIGAEIVLVHSLGIVGASWATGLSVLLLALLSASVSWCYIRWRFPVSFIWKITAAAGIALAPTFWVHAETFLTLAGGCVVWTIAFVTGLAIFKPLAQKDMHALGRIHPHLAGLAEYFSLQTMPVVVGGTPWQE